MFLGLEETLGSLCPWEDGSREKHSVFSKRLTRTPATCYSFVPIHVFPSHWGLQRVHSMQLERLALDRGLQYVQGQWWIALSSPKPSCSHVWHGSCMLLCTTCNHVFSYATWELCVLMYDVGSYMFSYNMGVVCFHIWHGKLCVLIYTWELCMDDYFSFCCDKYLTETT